MTFKGKKLTASYTNQKCKKWERQQAAEFKVLNSLGNFGLTVTHCTQFVWHGNTVTKAELSLY